MGTNQTSSFTANTSINGTPQAIATAAGTHTQAIVSQAVQQALNQAVQNRSSSHGQTGSQSQVSRPIDHATNASTPGANGVHNQNQHQPTAPASHLHPVQQAAMAVMQHQQQGTTAPAPAPAAGQGQQADQQHSSVSRVFKLQFDARRIVCCSQDSRIVGWDFANGDQDVMEASRFFIGP
jgi:F-box and WD-40 domain protein 1/11